VLVLPKLAMVAPEADAAEEVGVPAASAAALREAAELAMEPPLGPLPCPRAPDTAVGGGLELLLRVPLAAAAAAAHEDLRLLLLPLMSAGARPSGSGRSSAGWWAKKQMGRSQLGPSSHRHVMNLQDRAVTQGQCLLGLGSW
jgi:hypothetical protein